MNRNSGNGDELTVAGQIFEYLYTDSFIYPTQTIRKYQIVLQSKNLRVRCKWKSGLFWLFSEIKENYTNLLTSAKWFSLVTRGDIIE